MGEYEKAGGGSEDREAEETRWEERVREHHCMEEKDGLKGLMGIDKSKNDDEEFSALRDIGSKWCRYVRK